MLKKILILSKISYWTPSVTIKFYVDNVLIMVELAGAIEYTNCISAEV